MQVLPPPKVSRQESALDSLRTCDIRRVIIAIIARIPDRLSEIDKRRAELDQEIRALSEEYNTLLRIRDAVDDSCVTIPVFSPGNDIRIPSGELGDG